MGKHFKRNIFRAAQMLFTEFMTMTTTVKGARVESSAEMLDDHSAEIQDSDGESDGTGSEDEGSNEEGSGDEGINEEGSGDEGSNDKDEEDGDSDGEQVEDSDGEKERTEYDIKTEEIDDADGNTNAGWAEVMAKILQKKTPESKPIILLKNKQLDKIKEKEKQEYLERKKQNDKKRAWEMMCREKPDIVKDRENERNLQRIATRGVVQLFNAVRTHQRNIGDMVKEVGSSERKKSKLLATISKKDFIDVLRGADAGTGVGIKTQRQLVGREAKEKPAWSVLRDDFMIGASMKDWDKDSDMEGGELEVPVGAEDYKSESD
ncbi:hypothetical protein UPYG_G00144500 [Umbra pygmaea]|uniref:RRP15-like protein n=1 Tax=Umbra pygmaea TaxID=75934 RepID=A0ABD0X0E0_UMBPY